MGARSWFSYGRRTADRGSKLQGNPAMGPASSAISSPTNSAARSTLRLLPRESDAYCKFLWTSPAPIVAMELEHDRFRWHHIASDAASRPKREFVSAYRVLARSQNDCTTPSRRQLS